jgi:K+-sensing histidine kinase KdpD
MGTTARMHVLRYGSAVLVIALATVIRLLLDPVLGDRFAFITFFFAVVLVAWLWGLGPSLAALVLSWLSAAYFILPPRGTLWVQGADNQVGLVLFFLAGLAVALLSGSLRTVQQRAESAEEAERGQRQQLQVTLRSIGDAVIATDQDGRVTFLNPVAESLTGWSRAEADQQPLATVFRTMSKPASPWKIRWPACCATARSWAWAITPS